MTLTLILTFDLDPDLENFTQVKIVETSINEN